MPEPDPTTAPAPGPANGPANGQASDPATITVHVNGEARELSDGVTLGSLVAELGLADAVCATELNRSIVPHAERPGRALAAGDRVEIVTLVGGG